MSLTVISSPRLEPKILGKYPTESISYTQGGAVARARYQTLEEMDPTQVYPKIKIELVKSASQAENIVALERVAEMLRERATLPDEGAEVIPPARITATLAEKESERKEKAVAKYPRIITQEQYERDWKPKGWHLLAIGPTATYRMNWGIWEAIRDTVQNALDESEAYASGYDEDGLYIEDQGRGVGIQNFLLGPPKLKESWMRGRYGEGLKISSLSLIRLGYAVYVETVDTDICVIMLEVEARGKVQVLHALWRDSKRTRGTKFHFIGYFGDDFKDRFSVNLPASATLFRAPTPIVKPKQRYSQLIKYDFKSVPGRMVPYISTQGAPGKKNRIFIRDIYMDDRNTAYSYNLWGCDVAPDRQAPLTETDMWIDIGRLWACCDDVKLLEKFFRLTEDKGYQEGALEETTNLRIPNQPDVIGYTPSDSEFGGKSYIEVMKDHAAAWKKAWVNVFGKKTAAGPEDDVVLRIEPDLDRSVNHLNYRSVSLKYNVKWAVAEVIKTDRQLIDESQEKLAEVEIIPDKELSPRELIHLECARELIKNMPDWMGYPKGTYAAVIPPASNRTRTAGLYSKPLKLIYIDLHQLSNFERTIDTLDHEYAHHTSQAEDLEERHVLAISAVASQIAREVAGGVIDKYLEDPNFHW